MSTLNPSDFMFHNSFTTRHFTPFTYLCDNSFFFVRKIVSCYNVKREKNLPFPGVMVLYISVFAVCHSKDFPVPSSGAWVSTIRFESDGQGQANWISIWRALVLCKYGGTVFPSTWLQMSYVHRGKCTWHIDQDKWKQWFSKKLQF